MRLTPWFLLGFIGLGGFFGLLVFFCGDAKKGCELLRSTDEVHCNQLLAIPFISSLVCWYHLDPKVSNFLKYFELRNQTCKLQHDFI